MIENSKESFYSKIRCNIIETINSKEATFPYSTYTQYLITIDINIKKWKINRRFKEFEKLNKEISRKYSNLPSLPNKAIFSLRKSIVEERKLNLETYLNFIVNNLNLNQNQIILEFIELDKEILNLIKKKSLSYINFNKTSKLMDEDFFVKRTKSKSMDEKEKMNKEENSKLIETFLKNLEENDEEISNKIDQFWKTIRKDWPNFQKCDILKLFYGNGTYLKGLFSHCGDNLEKNSLGSENCLNLLSKLIMFDYNPYCENFINCIKMGNLEHYKKLNLNKHIQNNKTLVTEDCFNIINNILNNDKKDSDLKNILCKEFEDKYKHWLKIRDKL